MMATRIFELPSGLTRPSQCPAHFLGQTLIGRRKLNTPSMLQNVTSCLMSWCKGVSLG
jgi:hypothetical protein